MENKDKSQKKKISSGYVTQAMFFIKRHINQMYYEQGHEDCFISDVSISICYNELKRLYNEEDTSTTKTEQRDYILSWYKLHKNNSHDFDKTKALKLAISYLVIEEGRNFKNLIIKSTCEIADIIKKINHDKGDVSIKSKANDYLMLWASSLSKEKIDFLMLKSEEAINIATKEKETYNVSKNGIKVFNDNKNKNITVKVVLPTTLYNNYQKVLDKDYLQSNELYKLEEYKILRYEVLKEAKGICACCGRSIHKDNISLTLDHIKPRSLYPHLALDKSNLQALCKECNIGKGNHDETDFRNYNGV